MAKNSFDIGWNGTAPTMMMALDPSISPPPLETTAHSSSDVVLASHSPVIGLHTVSGSGHTTSSTTDGSAGTTAAGNNTRGGAIDPTGSFLYVANEDDDTISQYLINASSGALSPNGVPTVATTGSMPREVAVHPSGRFTYTANLDGTLSQFEIDPDSLFPRYFSGGLTALLRDGRKIARYEPHHLGSDKRPLPDDAVIDKFRHNAGRLYAADRVEAIQDAVMALNGDGTPADVTVLLGAP